MAEGQALSPRADALEVIVEILGALDGSTQSGREFYDRLCEACCRLGSMSRAGLLLYDDARQLVVVVGSHGVEAGLLSEVYGTLEETPIAQVALSEDRVVEVTGELGRWVPERYARLGGVETLCCVPVSAARALARGHLRRPRRHPLRADRRRARRPVDARQDGRARGERPDRNQPARPRAAAPGAHRPRARAARARRSAAVRRLARARLGLGAERGGAPALRRGDARRARGPARGALAATGAPHVRHRRHASATSWRGSAATTRTCRSSSSGRRGWRCRTTSSRWRSR